VLSTFPEKSKKIFLKLEFSTETCLDKQVRMLGVKSSENLENCIAIKLKSR